MLSGRRPKRELGALFADLRGVKEKQGGGRSGRCAGVGVSIADDTEIP